MSGQFPNPQSRRRNAPTISANLLPHEGRSGSAPKVPDRFELGDAGLAFWERAWKLPQAVKWDAHVDAVARRAELEDYAAALEILHEGLGLEEILTAGDDEELRRRIRNLEWMLDKIQRLATGAVGLMKQMDALDDRLGLNPKSLGQLRWTIADKPAKAESKTSADAAKVAQMADFRDRLG